MFSRNSAVEIDERGAELPGISIEKKRIENIPKDL